jgi:hypothetical protein
MCAQKGVVTHECFHKININFCKPHLQTTFESSVYLARFVLDEIRVLERVLQMLLYCLEQRENFADSGDFRL